MPTPYHTILPDDDDDRPEWAFICALLRQVIADASSVDPAVREDVARWLRTKGHVAWDAFLGMGGELAQAMEHVLSQQCVPAHGKRYHGL
jgi:hypothetical protein